MSTNSNLDAATGKGQEKYIVYVGTYGEGVYGSRFDTATGTLEPLQLMGKVKNPSWVTADKNFKHLYAVGELEGKKEGSVTSFSIDRQSGKLTTLNTVTSGGIAPCHASVDASGKTLVVANYTTGEVSAFPIQHDGSLGERTSLEKATGSSVNKERQEGPHAHEAVISADNKRVYVPDLGLDQIRVYRLDASAGKITPDTPAVVKGEGGLGPRHLAFRPDGKFAYVINELQPKVSVYSHDAANGTLHFVESVATIPADFTAENSGAEVRVHPSGKFVYTSNRGHDSIQVYAIDKEKGTLQQVQVVKTGGQEPRGFALDPTGHYLLVGNQKSDSLSIFKVDGETGKLTATEQKYDVPTPVDVLFVPAAKQ